MEVALRGIRPAGGEELQEHEERRDGDGVEDGPDIVMDDLRKAVFQQIEDGRDGHCEAAMADGKWAFCRSVDFVNSSSRIRKHPHLLHRFC